MRPIYKLNRVENKLSSILFANMHFLLYLCGANGNILPGHFVANNKLSIYTVMRLPCKTAPHTSLAQ